MVQQVEDYLVRLDQLLSKVRREVTFISRAVLRDEIANLGKEWFSMSTHLRGETSLEEEKINDVDALVEKVVELTMGTNRRSTYVKVLGDLKRILQRDILVPLIKIGRTAAVIWEGLAKQIIATSSSPEEKQFYDEAFTCAKNNCYKAATVLVASGVIDRLRSFVIKQGLSNFNTTSQKLKAKNAGYYKKFNKEFSLTLENELQEVFERDLIIVISGMISLDLNQTAAILKIFDTRNSCAHPSLYVMDELSFAHFLNEILKLILTNPALL